MFAWSTGVMFNQTSWISEARRRYFLADRPTSHPLISAGSSAGRTGSRATQTPPELVADSPPRTPSMRGDSDTQAGRRLKHTAATEGPTAATRDLKTCQRAPTRACHSVSRPARASWRILHLAAVLPIKCDRSPTLSWWSISSTLLPLFNLVRNIGGVSGRSIRWSETAWPCIVPLSAGCARFPSLSGGDVAAARRAACPPGTARSALGSGVLETLLGSLGTGRSVSIGQPRLERGLASVRHPGSAEERAPGRRVSGRWPRAEFHVHRGHEAGDGVHHRRPPREPRYSVDVQSAVRGFNQPGRVRVPALFAAEARWHQRTGNGCRNLRGFFFGRTQSAVVRRNAPRDET